MDANNTQYHLIYGERDWLPVLREQPFEQDSGNRRLWWDAERQAISLAPVIQQLKVPHGNDLSIEHRRGAAFDHYGNIYCIGPGRNKIFYSPHATPTKLGEYWSVEQFLSPSKPIGEHGDFCSTEATFVDVELQLSGLTVTSEDYLIVGTLAQGDITAGLLIFDLHGGGPPSWLRWPQSVDFNPWDFSATPDGGFFILDRNFSGNLSRVWHLDKYFRVLDCNGELISLATDSDFTGPEDMESRQCAQKYFYGGTVINISSPEVAEQYTAIEAVSDNAFILLDIEGKTGRSRICYFRNGEFVNAVDLDERVTGELLGDQQIFAHDFAYLSDADSDARVHRGRIFISSANYSQSYELFFQATEQELQLALRASLLPMRKHGGKALIASGGSVYYDFEDRWLPLAEQPRHHYQSQATLESSQLIFDGENPDCVWHRLIMDACVPPGTHVEIETRAANSLQTLASSRWHAEPQACLRAQGSELPLAKKAFTKESNHSGSWDCLFQNAVGRYLELRLTLAGTRRLTPFIKACRIYCPRFSYLRRYLPDVYQNDPGSASFLDRFLANVEGIFTHLEDKIANAQTLFDSRTVPPEFLEWLGAWVGALVDPAWDEQRKRLFLANVALLFRWRGTVAGLRTMIKLAIDPCPDDSLFDPLRYPQQQKEVLLGGRDIRIVEKFLTRHLVPARSDGSGATYLSQSTHDELWHPRFGAGALHKQYQQYLRRVYDNDVERINLAWERKPGAKPFSAIEEIEFSPLTPQQIAEARDWIIFTRDQLGFTYAEIGAGDLSVYKKFLALRYKSIARLNAAHELTDALENFESISMPAKLPRNITALKDWIDFVSLSLPIERQAHQFTVFLPTQLGEHPTQMEARRARVEDIVEREKPAHTSFEVQFFWAMFQVGSARVGIDTTLGEGGRFVAMVLGANFLGQSYLAESHPWDVVNRSVSGRERLAHGNFFR